jgi:hypothetical protein
MTYLCRPLRPHRHRDRHFGLIIISDEILARQTLWQTFKPLNCWRAGLRLSATPAGDDPTRITATRGGALSGAAPGDVVF